MTDQLDSVGQQAIEYLGLKHAARERYVVAPSKSPMRRSAFPNGAYSSAAVECATKACS